MAVGPHSWEGASTQAIPDYCRLESAQPNRFLEFHSDATELIVPSVRMVLMFLRGLAGAVDAWEARVGVAADCQILLEPVS